MKANEKTGALVGALTVHEADEITLITAGGQMLRIFVKDIREAGRATQRVKLTSLEGDDTLRTIGPVVSEQQEEVAAFVKEVLSKTISPCNSFFLALKRDFRVNSEKIIGNPVCPRSLRLRQ
ncbi:MAG: hypothetical protein ABSF95_19470 [Verrucomicrobiota bacterium]|jgi:hypothetical protein